MVAQLVRASACHAEGRGFESRPSRHFALGPFPSGSGPFCWESSGKAKLASLAGIGWSRPEWASKAEKTATKLPLDFERNGPRNLLRNPSPMKIKGPFKDKRKAAAGQAKCWYLSYFASTRRPDGTVVANQGGEPVVQRHRPYYETRAKAEADRARIAEQLDVTGTGSFVFDRRAAGDYESAKSIVGQVALVEVARFWRLHHPEQETPTITSLFEAFLADVEERLGKERHYSDLKSRGSRFVAAGFGERYPETVTRQEILDYLRQIPEAAPRSRRNHKTTICEFFNWLVDKKHAQVNPAAGIKKRMLPREQRQEIRFLGLDEVTRYLRTAERYDPDLVAHEVVQLLAGVRADDEMADFRAEFVLPRTKEVVIPAAVAKTEAREVITGLEDNFWAWWREYAPASGLLRPKNHDPRWGRIRFLATVVDQERADELGRLPIKHLLRMPEAKAALAKWPWNARRRSFCTYHVAKHESAAKTALIMRHRGSSYTLHNSYRGLGVTKEDGEAYFSIMPWPVDSPIRPKVVLRGAATGGHRTTQRF